uniref:Protein yippee-like n=1 Tax=Rhizophora mucronata TaxID=61149 RepID=A0A2P2K2H4_RHIMU
MPLQSMSRRDEINGENPGILHWCVTWWTGKIVICECVRLRIRKIMVAYGHLNKLYIHKMVLKQLVAILIQVNLFGRVNVSVGVMEERMMSTGLHTVADIFCVGCGSIVGWKYETAPNENQKYKEGKSVLERCKVCGSDGSNFWANHEAQVGGSDADDA